MSMDAPGYEQLAGVLQAAFDQAAKGKGAERHADSKPFHEQPMQTGSDLLGTDAGLAFQAIKKIREGSTFTEFDRFERELLGAIVYIAGMIIWRRRQLPKPVDKPMTYKERVAEADAATRVALTKAGYCPECEYPDDGTGTHYATCSKLTAPEGFVAEVEATFDELENPEPDVVCQHCGSREGAFHHADCRLMRQGKSKLATQLSDLVVGQESAEFLGAVFEGIAVDECTPLEAPFAGAPEWAKYKAQDANGNWYWFEQLPHHDDTQWVEPSLDGRYLVAPFSKPTPHWRDTLIERT